MCCNGNATVAAFPRWGRDNKRLRSQITTCRHHTGAKCDANSRFISSGRQ
jgi:hypothetical protein